MKWMRSAFTVLAAGGLALSGCDREELDDSHGDWKDPGRYAACQVSSTSTNACGDLETFDVSGCDKGSLDGVPRDGIYTILYRSDAESPSISASSFRISEDGSLDFFRGGAPTQREVGGDSFFLSSTRPRGCGSCPSRSWSRPSPWTSTSPRAMRTWCPFPMEVSGAASRSST